MNALRVIFEGSVFLILLFCVFRKDSEGSASMTDDNKKEEQEMSEWYNQLVLQDLQHLYLSENQLMTIALACQSPPVTLQLLDSGLPNLLTNAVLGKFHSS